MRFRCIYYNNNVVFLKNSSWNTHSYRSVSQLSPLTSDVEFDTWAGVRPHGGPNMLGQAYQCCNLHITQRCSGLLQMIPGMQHGTSTNSVLAQAKHVALEFPSRTAQLLYIQSECGQVECPVLIKASAVAFFQKKPKKPMTVAEHGHHDHPKLPCAHRLHI